MRYAHLTIGLVALGLTGCISHREAAYPAADFGQALRQNLTAQIADPTPQYTYDEALASNGPRTAVAQTRYETDTVTEATTQGTTMMRSTGSGGGGK